MTGAYAHNKALCHPERIDQLRRGEHPYPVHLHMVLSDLCNVDCPGCPYRQSKSQQSELFAIRDDVGQIVNHNPSRFLDYDLVLSVLDDCAAMGTKAIELTGGGEPTVHPRAREIIAYAQWLGLETAIVTNGILLDRLGECAVKSKWVRVSVDAATVDVYAKVRPSYGGGANHFETVKEQIRELVARRDATRTDCQIGFGFVVQKENWHQIVEATALAAELGCDNIRISAAFMPEGLAYHEMYDDAAIALEQIAIDKFSHRISVYDKFDVTTTDMASGPDDPRCSYEHFTTYLGADANLYRCCVTAYSKRGLIGNVVQAGGLKALWESEQKRTAFDSFDARQCEGQCRFCSSLLAINRAVDLPVTPNAPTDIIHPNFV